MLDPWIVAVHVPAGLVAVISGAGAMFAEKGRPLHRRCGRIYLVALGILLATGVALVTVRPPGLAHLLAPGAVAALSGIVGYRLRRRVPPTAHLLAMAGSYVAMLTAFYVDNGPKLPGWRLLPPVVFWFLPTIAAAPLVAFALRRHSRSKDQGFVANQ
jgi:uncharacterized membrane protein